MRILHISASGLPDGRVERMAVIDKLQGHETFYTGRRLSGFCLDSVFDECHLLPQTILDWIGTPLVYRKFKARTEQIIREVNPDIIHAHNIYVAQVVLDSGYPFILNDHELLSLQMRLDNRKRTNSGLYLKLYHKLLRHLLLVLWPIRERLMAQKAPIITVSDGIADYYEDLGGNCFVVPNYPTRFELSRAKFSDKTKTFTTTYLGSTLDDSVTYRDSAGLVDLFNKLNMSLKCIGDTKYESSNYVEFTGLVPHMQLFTEMSKYHVGIVPWRKHPYHRICSLNKVYAYAHCGLVVVVTSFLDEVIKSFKGRCRVIERYEDLEWVLQDLENDMDATIAEGQVNKEFAEKNFILENYKDVVEEAYRNA